MGQYDLCAEELVEQGFSLQTAPSSLHLLGAAARAPSREAANLGRSLLSSLVTTSLGSGYDPFILI